VSAVDKWQLTGRESRQQQPQAQRRTILKHHKITYISKRVATKLGHSDVAESSSARPSTRRITADCFKRLCPPQAAASSCRGALAGSITGHRLRLRRRCRRSGGLRSGLGARRWCWGVGALLEGVAGLHGDAAHACLATAHADLDVAVVTPLSAPAVLDNPASAKIHGKAAEADICQHRQAEKAAVQKRKVEQQGTVQDGPRFTSQNQLGNRSAPTNHSHTQQHGNPAQCFVGCSS
jgi:hypothetical protein